MKKFFYLIGLSLLAIGCGGGDSDSSPAEEPNSAPTKPVLISPANANLCVSNVVEFQWNPSTDANKDAITYVIQLATDNQFSQIVKTQEGTNSSQVFTLEKGKSYYWRVKAIDSKNLSGEYSSTNSFYTESDVIANHLPFAPELVLPVLNSTINSGTISLSWKATDVDAADVLLYDVYLGTSNPPTQKIATNNATGKLDVVANSSNIYYWKVVVKDNHGGETIGQIWNFKTN